MRFDTNVHSTSDWKFYPEKNTIDLKPGEVHTVKFNVENPSSKVSSGSASFNVSPSPFGIYLNKIGCFCFEKQTLKPNEKQEFVLTFFLDPKVVDDNKTKNPRPPSSRRRTPLILPPIRPRTPSRTEIYQHRVLLFSSC